MSQALTNLLALLNLEKIEEGLFRGQSEDLGLRQVFGGQVVGQALYAAKETVPAERLIHSFHSYFLRPGDSQKPIIYDVEVLRDGNSFQRPPGGGDSEREADFLHDRLISGARTRLRTSENHASSPRAGCAAL